VQRANQRAAWNRPVLWPIALLAGGLVAVIAPAVIAWRRREEGRA
jgi:oligopeptide transport system substrate-binding protein